MFGKRAPDSDKATSKERFATLIGEHTGIRGDLMLSDSIRIDGQVEGNIRRRRDQAVTVVVGPTGKVTGDVEASRVVVAGMVQGALHADDDVDLMATAVVEGDVHCKSLRVALGARLTGRILTHEQATTGSKPVLVIGQGETPEAAARRA